MDEDTFDVNACVTTGKSKPSPYCDLYKVPTQIDQNKRREQLLTEQRSRRNNLLDEARGFNLETNEDTKQNSKRKSKQYVKEYKNKIMLSEWLIELAPDFDVSWIMKICPEGHRNLVVAHKNCTKSYSKTGRFEYKFHSVLPGGNGSGNDNQGWKTTILDCVFNEKTNAFYILDVLMWADYDLTEYDAEFRFFWLQSKILELPELEILSTSNDYHFRFLPHITCDYSLLKDSLEKFPYYENNTPSVDGLLFYHKEASYTAGRTPLVGWLKPFMVPEILKIPVSAEYLALRPEKYLGLLEHIEFSKQVKKIKHTTVEMDMS